MGVVIFVVFGLSIFAPIISRFTKPIKNISPVFLLAGFSAGIFTWFILQIPLIAGGAVLVERYPWSPRLGIEFHFSLDGLALLMSLLISGIGTLVILYGGEYLHEHPALPRFYSLTFLFMGAMLGVVLSGNALILFLFWELTGISSFFLIGFDHQRESARSAAWQALLVTGAGGLAMLAGLVLVGQITSTYDMKQWVTMAQVIQASPVGKAAFVLILLGAVTKSAQFPFHFWLPNAMEAPAPVSAYLHSATMVKAGLYLMARLFPVFGGLALWQPLLMTIGILTILTGALLTLGQTDLKKLLAYTTIAALGTILFLLGVGSPLAIKGALAFLFGHALYKGALFLTAGSVDHGAGTRDLRRLGGLARAMPFSAAAGTAAALSMAGLPPFFGFIAKEFLYESLLPFPDWSAALIVLVFLAYAVIAAAAGWSGLLPFWRKARGDLHAHESPAGLWLPPLILAVFGLFFGLFPQLPAQWLLTPALSAVLAEPGVVKLSLWHGITPVLGLSLLTLLAGGGIYVLQSRLQPASAQILRNFGKIGPANGYQRGLKGLLWFAAFQTRLLQNGYLRIYVATVIITTIGLVGATSLLRQGLLFGPLTPAPRFYDVVLIAVILAAAVLVIRTASRLATIALLGSIGFSISILFLLYSAPDLAMVQFAIETLTVILFILAIYRLPKFAALSSRRTHLVDGAIAILGGLMMTLLMLLTSFHPGESLIAPFFLENSLTLANGRNVVNVILVDFRAFDTLGEITVLAIAAIGVSALLRLIRPPAEPSNAIPKEAADGSK